jgi:DNA-binding response OmpR family regulator
MRGHILLVDPEPTASRQLAAVLAQAEFTVTTAASGPAALRLAHRAPPDLILLELALPGMDGMETLRQFRGRGITATVMIHTAHGTPEHARKARALGAREFLGKPFGADRLLRLIGEEIGERVRA